MQGNRRTALIFILAGIFACGSEADPAADTERASALPAGSDTAQPNDAAQPSNTASPPSMAPPNDPAPPSSAGGADPTAPSGSQPNGEMPVAPSGIAGDAEGAGGPGSADGDGAGMPAPSPEDPPAEDPAPPEDAPPAAFAPCPTDGTPCSILPLGDSITFGIGSSGGGYRVELFRQAAGDDRSITFVGTAPPNGPQMVDGQVFPRSHQGHSGFTISGGGAGSLAGLVDASLAATDPNIILLMIGTNDINLNLDIQSAPARLAALLDQITSGAPDALLVVAQIVPTTNAATNARVQAYNAAIPALVQARAEQGQHILLVDMFTPFVENQNFGSELMNDFLHPNDAGYVVMAQTWYATIEEFLPAP